MEVNELVPLFSGLLVMLADLTAFFLILRVSTAGDFAKIKKYGQDDLIFLMLELLNLQQFDKSDIDRFEHVVGKYTNTRNKALELISSTINEIDGKFASLSEEIKEKLYLNINIVTRIMKGVKNPHKNIRNLYLRFWALCPIW